MTLNISILDIFRKESKDICAFVHKLAVSLPLRSDESKQVSCHSHMFNRSMTHEVSVAKELSRAE